MAAIENWSERRTEMVREQIEARGISDERVLAAMRSVPRHEFVSADLAQEAYEDHPLPIGHGQTISQPYIVAYMTALLKVEKQHEVLEIGTGCGYQTAVLSRLCSRVFTIEIVVDLMRLARKNLDRAEVHNVEFYSGDGGQGWPIPRQFDRILVAAAPARIPEALLNQLAPGGRMILPVGTEMQDLMLVEHTDSGIRQTRLLGVRFVPLVKYPSDAD
jgi:protein-L-isoaspartate(D-aspartate) O-methyltransferase